MGNFKINCPGQGYRETPEERGRRSRVVYSRRYQLASKRPGTPNSSEDSEDAGAGCAWNRSTRIPRTPSANPIPVGMVGDRGGRLSRNGGLDRSGLSKTRRRRGPAGLQWSALDYRTWRAGAHTAGAQPRGSGTSLRGSWRVSLTRSPHSLRLLRSPDRTSSSTDSRWRFANTHALRRRTSGQFHLLPGVLGDAPHQGLPRGHAEKTKGQSGRCSRQEYPLVTTQAEKIPEAKLRMRALAVIEQGMAGRPTAKSGKAKLEVFASWVLPGCSGGWRGGSWVGGIC